MPYDPTEGFYKEVMEVFNRDRIENCPYKINADLPTIKPVRQTNRRYGTYTFSNNIIKLNGYENDNAPDLQVNTMLEKNGQPSGIW